MQSTKLSCNTQCVAPSGSAQRNTAPLAPRPCNVQTFQGFKPAGSVPKVTIWHASRSSASLRASIPPLSALSTPRYAPNSHNASRLTQCRPLVASTMPATRPSLADRLPPSCAWLVRCQRSQDVRWLITSASRSPIPAPRDVPLDRYRNIGIMAHIDAGKVCT